MTTKNSINTAPNPPRDDAAPISHSALRTSHSPHFVDILALALATTLAVWTTAYICRVPMISAPAPLTIALMLAAILLGGFVAGRYTHRGTRGGLYAGALSGVVNLLIISSIISELHKNHSPYATPLAMLLWPAGSISLTAALAAIGAFLGKLTRTPATRDLHWPGLLAWTLPIATFPLITAGGLVTAWGSGLAVPDWPNSFGYNMFLLPLSQMQGGVFYEHAHRLMGTLVGLIAITLAVYTSCTEKRSWVIAFAWLVVLGVGFQGLLGGLRVTGHITTATAPAAMAPSTELAIIHGVFAQLLFATMTALAAVCSRAWQSPRTQPLVSYSAQTDYALTFLLVGVTSLQLFLGALLRHKDLFVTLHITNAVVVAILAFACGLRAWGLYESAAPLKRTGLVVICLVFLQLLLGVAALIFRTPLNLHPTPLHALSTTLHQANGALLMASTLTLAFWTARLLRLPPPKS